MIGIVFVSLTCLLLLLLLVFNYFNRSIELGTSDVEFLRKKNLYALHICRILESSDYRSLSRANRKYRDYLFLNYARNLRQDIRELARLPLGLSAYLYFFAFNVFYFIMVVKNRIFSGTNDLRVLLGIELMLVRQLAH